MVRIRLRDRDRFFHCYCVDFIEASLINNIYIGENDMRKIFLGLIASLTLLPAASFAQTTPQPPASWVAFKQAEHAKQVAFFQQIKADREAFLSANPDVKTYLQQLHASTRAREAAWRASHQSKIPTAP
jgi:hypothetical protein